MKLIYIIGPYRAKTPNGIRDNIERARAEAVRILQSGDFPVCPHTNTGYMDGVVDDQVFLDGDLMLLRRCHEAHVLPGWEKSQGSSTELAHAREWGMPITMVE